MPNTPYRKFSPKKPATPQQQLEAAIARAQAEGLKVFAICKILATGERGWLVPSQSVPGMCHVVSRAANGSLQCDCYYSSQRGKVCAHRACVYLHLKSQPAEPGRGCIDCGYVCKLDKNGRCEQCAMAPAPRLPVQPTSSEASARPVAISSPDAPTAPSATLGVSRPTQTPQGVLVAATTPQVGISDEDAWGRYQDARMRGFDQDFWPTPDWE